MNINHKEITNMCLKISVVTVCYNMAQYIEATIKSVLSQGYPNLEYIVIDGGSTDGTQQIIERYKDQLAYYISESDNGMYDAICKGFGKVTGDILAWINADDIYMPWTLQTVNEVFSSYPEIQWLGGKYAFLGEDGLLSQIFPKTSIKAQKDISKGWCRSDVLGPLQQESMFWRKELYILSGGLDTSYKYAGDFELWTRFAKYASLTKIDIPLAAFRRRSTSLSKAGKDKYDSEVENVIKNKQRFPNILWRMLHKSGVFVQLLRILRYRKGEILFYNMKTQKLTKKSVLCNSSNHTFQSLKLYG